MVAIITWLEIIGMVAGGAYLVSRIEATTKSNKEAIDKLAELIKQNTKDMKDLLQLNKEQQRDALNREISHIKDLISISNTEMREDIKRLQEAQNKANHLQERIALINASVKSLHKRLDLDPPILMDKLVEE